jgi:hypothetical protein
MAASAALRSVGAGVTRAPRLSMLWAVAIVGCAAAAGQARGALGLGERQASAVPVPWGRCE